MKNLAIKAENISKQYRLGEVGTGTLSHDLNRFWAKMRGKEDPYLEIGESNNRAQKGTSDYVWSLRDINFEIAQGDAVGIIGRNGAGKSTLLKLLSKVTKPTTGSFKVNGRIASLLEVGTGFNPEMTGRENIYLNGAILGMRKHEITRKFDEIVDFSGVERYIDTPVKRYSSGMYVRLAFAVAAHLESEILIVDEVLAVGDAEFQKKCLGKMGDVSKGEGRTVLFVSHQLGSVATLCNKGMLMDKGKISDFGNVNKIIELYTDFGNIHSKSYFAVNTNRDLYLLNCSLLNEKNNVTSDFLSSELIIVNFFIKQNRRFSSALLSFTIQSNTGDYITTVIKSVDDILKNKNENEIQIKFNADSLAPNNYYIRIAIFDPSSFFVYDLQEMICPFRINDFGTDMARFEGVNYGYFNLKHDIFYD